MHACFPGNVIWGILVLFNAEDLLFLSKTQNLNYDLHGWIPGTASNESPVGLLLSAHHRTRGERHKKLQEGWPGGSYGPTQRLAMPHGLLKEAWTWGTAGRICAFQGLPLPKIISCKVHLLPRQAQHMHPAIKMELRTEEWHCPSQPLASAGLQMCLHELPLQQEWEKTASDGGYCDNCPPITSNSLQLELLYQAPAHLFFSLFIYIATPWNVHGSKLRHLYDIGQVLACSSTYIIIQVKVLQTSKMKH